MEHKCIIESIFDDNLNWNDYANQVILCPTNDDTLTLNDKVLAMLLEDERIYYSYSTDYIECDNDIDKSQFPIEFLHSLTPPCRYASS